VTVTSQENRTSAVGEAGTQVVPFTFPILNDADITVYLVVTATGVQTLFVQDTDYELVNNGDSGGTVETKAAAGEDNEIHVIRDTAATQNLDLTVGGGFSSDNQESAYDKNMRITIENKNNLDRTLILPEGESDKDMTLPLLAERANKTMVFDGSGLPSVSDDDIIPGEVSVSPYWVTVLTSVSDITSQISLGILNENDLGSESQFYPPTQSSVKAYVNTQSGIINAVNQAEADPTGVSDSTDAINFALTAADLFGGWEVLLPAGTYLVSGLSINVSNVTLRGSSEGSTTIILADDSDVPAISIANQNNFAIEDITIDGNGINQAAGDGINIQTCNNLRLRNVKIQNTFAYGLHFEDGTIHNVFIDNLKVTNTGSNGIEIKNTSSNNRTMFFNNIVLDDCLDIGFNVRGPIQINGIEIVNLPANDIGINLAVTDGSGLGANYTTVNNFNIRGSSTGTKGIAMGCTYAMVQNGSIDTLATGVSCTGSLNSLSNIIATNCTVGIDFGSAGSSNKLVNSHITTSSVGVQDAADYTLCTNNVIFGSASFDVLVGALSSFSSYMNNKIVDVSDGGTGTRIRNNVDYITESWGTATIGIGTAVTPNIPHGLSAAPTDILITPQTDLADNENWWVDPADIDATNFLIRLANNAGADVDFSWEAKVR
jgi:hypothetical protein